MIGIPSIGPVRQLGRIAAVLAVCGALAPADDPAPKADERQLPRSMHSAMSERPAVTVGRADADIVGADNRALQAAVDYVAGLGGGVVQIGEGEYLMRDSLHLRPGVTVRGKKGKTILHKADGAVTPLALDGDFGEQQITVADPAGFGVGQGVAIWDDHAGGFHTTVGRITGRRGNTFAIDTPMMADCMVANHAKAATVFPVVSGRDIEGAVVEDLVVDGQRPVMKNCVARNNGTDGLFLCWRVRHGVFEDNRLEGNGRFGISIGHKDSDNLLRGNQVVGNASNGVCFRDESGGMSPHRNRLEGNRIEDNGREPGTAGIRIGGEPTGLIFEGNVIRDTREGPRRTQTVGILVEGRVGPVRLGSNEIEASPAVEDRRRGAAGADSPK
ncbi:MAG: right-handed parallel beta-helix repeat-containing protein [Planctomycetia bacterium]|nr:right-handed parallel beta-helix repeat-containing protein [Planctomycetia bacterium]